MVAQQAAPAPAFEVASIKPCTPGDTGRGGGGGGRSGGGPPGDRAAPSPDRLTVGCQPLINIMRQAYVAYANGQFNNPASNPGYTLIEGGPAWAKTDRYQITAKAEGTPGQEMMRGPMLQALLEDRFQLKIHRETREVPVYAVTVAKGGPKLEAFDAATCLPLPMPPPTNPIPAAGQKPYCDMTVIDTKGPISILYMSGRTVGDFARLLGNALDRPVIDKTGIEGKFNFHLEFLPDETTTGAIYTQRPGEPRAPVDPAGGPSIFTVLQNYGLKLEPAKGPRNFIVIDRAEKPSEN